MMLRAALVLLLAASTLPPSGAAQATDAAPCVDPAGDYATDFGKMHFNASGATGDYEWDQGRLTGSYSASTSTLTGRWSEAPTYAGPSDAGDYSFVFSAGCASFLGHWKHDSDPPGSWSGSAWNGNRISPPPTTTTTTPTTTPVPMQTTTTTPAPSTTLPGPTVDEIRDLFPEDNTTPRSNAPACDMTGLWTTDEGTVEFHQEGDWVEKVGTSGNIVSLGGYMSGRNVTGLVGYPNTPSEATVTMELRPDCDAFTGTLGAAPPEWNYARTWAGTRVLSEDESTLKGVPGPHVALVIATLALALLLSSRRSRS